MKSPETFFLTGCASGIGQHIAGRLIAQGHKVFATDISYEKMVEYAREHQWPADRVILKKLDVTDHDAWMRIIPEAAAAFGQIDVVMNIAGYMQSEWCYETKPEVVNRHIDINIKGVVYGTKAAAQQMMKQGHGHIINIASMSALAPIPGIAVYSASKYACRAFSIAAALELRPHNIYVTAINPDAVQTPLLAPQKGVEAAAIVFSGSRLLTVEDIAHAILDQALRNRPLEVNIPRFRGWLAHFSNLFPQIGFLIGPLFSKKGSKKQNEFFAKGA